MSGMNHFRNMDSLTAYAASKDIASPRLAVFITGLMIFVGGIGITLGAYLQLSILLIAVFLLAVSFMMHDFWNIEDEAMKNSQMGNFSRNMALLGGDLFLFFIPLPWPMSLLG